MCPALSEKQSKCSRAQSEITCSCSGKRHFDQPVFVLGVRWPCTTTQFAHDRPVGTGKFLEKETLPPGSTFAAPSRGRRVSGFDVGGSGMYSRRKFAWPVPDSARLFRTSGSSGLSRRAC